MTRYPIYVPSKGRPARCLTGRLMDTGGVPFRIVVEEPERDEYAAEFGPDRLLVLPDVDRGITVARNWIKDHAMSEGHTRHWQFDDNISCLRQWDAGNRDVCEPAPALASMEGFVDRYTNVAIAGLQHTAFGHEITTPFSINKMAYSAVLVNSDDYRWRGTTGGEDVDYSIQVLVGGECTILFRHWQIEKAASGAIKGGNTELYEEAGRVARIRELQAAWPGLVNIERRWDRPRHNLNQIWRKFDQPLIRREP